MIPIKSTLVDELAAFNRERWDDLARARVEFSVPALHLDTHAAQTMVDEQGALGDVSGKRVLCLAAGGGQQSSAFALLGAKVTVLDLSPIQLERDALAAKHYGCPVQLELGDMRDLSRFADAGFDIVWQAHSLNFVPDAKVVFGGVSRVLAVGGMYRLQFTNPFIHGTWESSWTGTGYLLAGPCRDEEVASADRPWECLDDHGVLRRVAGPREFRHILSTVVNGLIGARLQIRGLWEDTTGDPCEPPGSWRHFKFFAAPWLTIVAKRAA